MPDLRALLEHLEGLHAEQARLIGELRAALAEAQTPAGNGLDEAADDFAEPLLDTTSASERFNFPRDTIAKWCREGCGRKVGGRWMASAPRIARRLNGR